MASAFDMFTTAAKKAFLGAQLFARRLGYDAISPEMFLMALLMDRECDAGRVLDALGLDREAAWGELNRLAPLTGRLVQGHVPLSTQSKVMVHRAIGIRETLARSEIATDVLLLAIADDAALPASAVLRAQDILAADVVAEMVDPASVESVASRFGAARARRKVKKDRWGYPAIGCAPAGQQLAAGPLPDPGR